MTQYKIIKAKTIKELEKEVNKFLNFKTEVKLGTLIYRQNEYIQAIQYNLVFQNKPKLLKSATTNEAVTTAVTTKDGRIKSNFWDI